MISYVIPTLNESRTIEHTLARLREADPLGEILVCDGGSTDGTRSIADRHATRVIEVRRPSRGFQLNQGAQIATGDALCFFHADVVPPSDLTQQIRNALAEPRVVAGGFRIRYDDGSAALRLLGLLSRLPWSFTYFGDQGFFCRRADFNRAGGFPEWPLFEEVELARRMRARGRLVRASAVTTASARRFAERGPWRQLALNAGLCALYSFGVSPHRLARWYGPPVRRAEGAFAHGTERASRRRTSPLSAELGKARE